MWLWGLLTQRQETDHFNKDGECLLIHYGGFLECHLTLRGLTRCSYYFSVEFSPHLRVDEFWENNVLFRPVIIFGISLPTTATDLIMYLSDNIMCVTSVRCLEFRLVPYTYALFRLGPLNYIQNRIDGMPLIFSNGAFYVSFLMYQDNQFFYLFTKWRLPGKSPNGFRQGHFHTL